MDIAADLEQTEREAYEVDEARIRKLLTGVNWNKHIRWIGEDRMTFAMVEPTNYGIAPPNPKYGSANDMEDANWPEYKKDPKRFIEKTVIDWHKAIDAVSSQANTVIIPTMPNTDMHKFYDQVFTADASLSAESDGVLTTFFSHFSNIERSWETQIHREFLKAVDLELHKRGHLSKLPEREFLNMPYHFEGTGDCRYDDWRGLFWAGYTKTPGRAGANNGRSDIRSHDIIRSNLNAPVFSIETKKPFFHIDTALLPMSETPHIFLYPGGVQNLDIKAFKQEAFGKYGLNTNKHLIEMSKKAAFNWAANSLYIGGHTIVVPEEAGKEFTEQVKRTGMHVLEVPAKYLVKAGGAYHCIQNQIYRKYIPGGLREHENMAVPQI